MFSQQSRPKSMVKIKFKHRYPSFLMGLEPKQSKKKLSNFRGDELINSRYSSFIAINNTSSHSTSMKNVANEIVEEKKLDSNNSNTINRYKEKEQKIVIFDDSVIQLPNILHQLLTDTNDRHNHYKCLIEIFQTKFLGFQLDNRLTNLVTIIESGLRNKSNDNDEIGLSINILTLTIITMGNEFNAQFESLYLTLRDIVIHSQFPPSLRSNAAISLSIGCFITEFGCEKMKELLLYLLSIGLAQDHIHKYGKQIISLKSLCLKLFLFLSTKCDIDYVTKIIGKYLDKIFNLFDSNDSEMRVSVGLIFVHLIERHDHLQKPFQCDFGEKLNS
uniref:Uncharacterized protein LOC113798794 n=1 Tax=Dermatophagoides pteronyssinus TaxID=6956 RepID=A0A6P6YIS0_DERPT|nr:uncharacterized protein LOC113798794 [Dermatophagoides pteronyssinus]